MTVRILTGDCRTMLATLPDASVQCCVTSPPYFNLRSYLDDGHPDKALEIGAEQTPDAYVAELVAVFREVRRVLRDDGCAWINLGDSYAAGGLGAGSGKQLTNVGAALPPKKAPPGYKPKDLLGIPWAVAFALRADGWWLRSDIIWHKMNPMPESVQGSHFSRHMVTIAEYERLSGLPYVDERAGSDWSGDVPFLSEIEIPRGKAPLSAEREGQSYGSRSGRAAGRAGKAASVRRLGAGQEEPGQILENREGQGDSAEGRSEVFSDRERQAQGCGTSSGNEGYAASNCTEEACGSDLCQDGQDGREEASRLREAEGSHRGRRAVHGGDVAHARGAAQEPLSLLQAAAGIDPGPRDPCQQGREARGGEHRPSVPDLQLEEGQQDRASRLVGCPGCEKCAQHNGYTFHLSAGRPTSAHEHVFLLSKRERYFWDADAVREENANPELTECVKHWKDRPGNGEWPSGTGGRMGSVQNGRNLRNVWTIATQPFSGKTYDFAGADYVDDHGIPRKLSPDCRVHGLREQLRPETPSASVCGGLKADPCIRTSTDDRPALGQPHAADPTGSYTGSSALDNRSKRNAENTLASRTPSLPPCAEVDGTQSSNSGIQQPDAQPMLGFDPHVAAQIASASNTQSHRTDPGSRSLQRDIAFASLPQNTSHSGQEPGGTQLCERTRESKSGVDRPASHETPTALSEPASHTSRTRSGKSSKQDKCSCAISKVDHFAVMPPDLAERCIKAGTSERGQCPHCGAPWARVVERTKEPTVRAGKDVYTGQAYSTPHSAPRGPKSDFGVGTGGATTGWSPTCACPAHTPAPQTILDPFGGAGTTGLVADRLGRNAVLIELNPDYAKLARNRVTADAPLFAEVAD